MKLTEKDFLVFRVQSCLVRETSILMMCDSVEAASKSMKEPSSHKIDSFVESIIGKQMETGQFLNADITFKEIQLIKKVLKKS